MDQVKYLKSSGINISIFKFSPQKNPFKYFSARLRLSRKVKNNNFDLIHAHYGQSGFISKFKGIPLITTFHGTDIMGIVGENGRYTFLGKVLSFISKITSMLSNHCICVSNRIASRLPKNVRRDVIPCGIDTNHFRKMDKDKCKKIFNLNEEKHILFAGDPNKTVKNYKLALESFNYFQSNSKIKAKLIPLKGYLRSEVPKLLNAVDVLLVTSFHEGSPMIVKEALSCNTPIISVDVGDVSELINEVDGSYLVLNKTKEAIAEKLEKVFMKEVRIDKSLIEKIDLNYTNRKLLQTYKMVMGT